MTCDLADGQEREIVFTLGAGRNRDDAAHVLAQACGAGVARRALEAIWHYWSHTLGAVNVDTPDRALNTLANGWLVYQTTVCRLWGRSGFYQSGGAFGFRDQLQDVMALIHCVSRSQVRIEPCLPADWNGFTVHYRYRETVYHIAVHQTRPPTGAERVTVDGRDETGMSIPLADDHEEHRVEVWVASAVQTST